MRVIAGSAGGIHLTVPPRGVRPTMERVKAAIFSSLANQVIGARGRDLFAASGALAIEALSRGGASILLGPGARPAAGAREKNPADTNREDTCRQHEAG